MKQTTSKALRGAMRTLCLLLVLAMVIPYMANPASAATQTKNIKGMEYTPDEYEATAGGEIWLRDENDKPLILIEAGSKVRVLGKYTEPCSLEKTKGNRSVMQFEGHVGHARDGLLKDKKSVDSNSHNATSGNNVAVVKGMEYTPGEYYAKTTCGLYGRDKDDKEVIYIPSGTVVKVLGKYTEVCKVGSIEDKGNRSVMEYGGYTIHARDNGLTKVEVPALRETKYSNCYAVTNTTLNGRAGASDTEGFLKELDPWTVVRILGESVDNPRRLVVVYGHGQVMTILNNVSIIDDNLATSIERQKTMVFTDGKLIGEFDCVTGNVSKGWDTHTGKFKVKNRLPRAYMAKYDVWADHCWLGLEEVGTENNYGEGFHDSKRTTFGGNVYETNGSHGCINLSEEAAKFVYKNSYEGEIVYISQT